MNILDRSWKRLLLALLLGGIMAEGVSRLTNQKVGISLFVLAIIFYFVFSNIYHRSLRDNTTGER